MMRIFDKEYNAITDLLKSYAVGRKNNVERGLESPILAALLVEKYAWGQHEALTVIDSENGSRDLIKLADKLCFEIDNDFELNRQHRYQGLQITLSGLK